MKTPILLGHNRPNWLVFNPKGNRCFQTIYSVNLRKISGYRVFTVAYSISLFYFIEGNYLKRLLHWDHAVTSNLKNMQFVKKFLNFVIFFSRNSFWTMELCRYSVRWCGLPSVRCIADSCWICSVRYRGSLLLHLLRFRTAGRREGRQSSILEQSSTLLHVIVKSIYYFSCY